MSGANDPFARQREHDAVLAVLTSYGRRCGHQALRKGRNGAHTAPPRDCRANTMPPPALKGSGEKQTKYESDTPPHGLRFANKASRIFRFPVETVKYHHQIVGLLPPRTPQMETGGPSVGQTEKESAIAKSPRAAPQRQAPTAASTRHPQTSSPNRRPVGAAPCLKQGLAGLSVAQTVKESAIAKSARAALQRQAAIGAVARADKSFVKAHPRAP